MSTLVHVVATYAAWVLAAVATYRHTGSVVDAFAVALALRAMMPWHPKAA